LHALQFLHASAMVKHVIDIGWTSVHPSVCPSHAGIVSLLLLPEIKKLYIIAQY